VSDDTTELARAYEYLSAARTEAHNIQALQRHGDRAHAAERISDLVAWLASLDTTEEPSGLRADNERLRAIVTQLADSDDEPCVYDHHGYCQTHLVGKPCLIAAARETIYINQETSDAPA